LKGEGEREIVRGAADGLMLFDSVDRPGLLRRDEAVEQVFFHQSFIAVFGRSPATAGWRGDLDPVAGLDRHIGEFARRDLIEGLGNSEPFFAACALDEEFGPAAFMKPRTRCFDIS
jgi:hypothetical protein